MNVIEKSCRCPVIFLIVGAIALVGFGLFGGWRTTSVHRDALDSQRDAEHSRQVGLIRDFVGELDSGFAALEGNLGTIKAGISGDATDIRSLAGRIIALAEPVAAMEDEILYRRRSIAEFWNNNAGVIACTVEHNCFLDPEDCVLVLMEDDYEADAAGVAGELSPPTD